MSGFEDLGYARPDLDREARLGLPEVVYGPGKTPSQVVGVVRSLLAGNDGPVLVTRIAAEDAAEVGAAVAGGSYDPVARLLVWRPAAARPFRVVVASAGTSDEPVAAEAAAVATAIGLQVHQLRDGGVAGLHRLLAETERLSPSHAPPCVA